VRFAWLTMAAPTSAPHSSGWSHAAQNERVDGRTAQPTVARSVPPAACSTAPRFGSSCQPSHRWLAAWTAAAATRDRKRCADERRAGAWPHARRDVHVARPVFGAQDSHKTNGRSGAGHATSCGTRGCVCCVVARVCMPGARTADDEDGQQRGEHVWIPPLGRAGRSRRRKRQRRRHVDFSGSAEVLRVVGVPIAQHSIARHAARPALEPMQRPGDWHRGRHDRGERSGDGLLDSLVER